MICPPSGASGWSKLGEGHKIADPEGRGKGQKRGSSMEMGVEQEGLPTVVEGATGAISSSPGLEQ